VPQKIQYTLQIGTDFDGGQELIWTLIKEENLHEENLFIPRPRTYRHSLANQAKQNVNSLVAPDYVRDLLSIPEGASQDDLHYMLSVKEIMQAPQNFCPAGDWFHGLGERSAQYRALFAPSKLKFMISLRNPASMLSDAWASGSYTGFEDIPPDPFDLRWAVVLRDLRQHCPDAPVVAWCAEESPLIWKRILNAAVHPQAELSVAAVAHIAKGLMIEEGGHRLEAYLGERQNLSEEKRVRAIAIFLEKFARDKVGSATLAIPGWSKLKQDRMDEQYALDLKEVAQIEGVTLIKV